MPKVLNKYRDSIPAQAIYCGRGSLWGNPFKIGFQAAPEDTPLSRDEACDLYEAWAPQQWWWRHIQRRLRGRDLVCFCAPKRCHCDFLLREANAPMAPSEPKP